VLNNPEEINKIIDVYLKKQKLWIYESFRCYSGL
jgi:hypothetical protein